MGRGASSGFSRCRLTCCLSSWRSFRMPGTAMGFVAPCLLSPAAVGTSVVAAGACTVAGSAAGPCCQAGPADGSCGGSTSRTPACCRMSVRSPTWDFPSISTPACWPECVQRPPVCINNTENHSWMSHNGVILMPNHAPSSSRLPQLLFRSRDVCGHVLHAWHLDWSWLACAAAAPPAWQRCLKMGQYPRGHPRGLQIIIS